MSSTQGGNEAVVSANFEEQFRSVFDGIPIGLFIFSFEGALIDVNPAMCSMLGYTKEELLELEPKEFIHPNSHHLFEDFVQAGKEKRPFHCLAQDICKDGSIIDIELFGRLIMYQDEPRYLCLVQDISHRMLLEAQLRQSQKMEAVGLLAGGIAHDFNNLLSVIGGTAELGESGKHSAAESKELFSQIRQASKRAKEITGQLLAFGRRQQLSIQHLDINQEIGSFYEFLDRLMGEHLHVQLDLADDLPLIAADQSQLQQVLLNLALNARDSMPQGGTLYFRTKFLKLPEERITVHSTIPPGEYVVFIAEDEGCGIPQVLLPRVLDPFFTTKEIGQGTGLGLSTVYGIIRQHAGHLEIDSELKKGTKVSLLFPAKEGKPLAPQANGITEKSEVLEDVRPKSSVEKRIMLVEDEAMLRELIGKLLQREGYEVIFAKDGLEAYQMITQEQEKIDLLITDLVMPNLDGRTLFSRLQKGNPDLKVIYMSGYPRDYLSKQQLADNLPNFIQKPFSNAAFLDLVRENV